MFNVDGFVCDDYLIDHFPAKWLKLLQIEKRDGFSSFFLLQK